MMRKELRLSLLGGLCIASLVVGTFDVSSDLAAQPASAADAAWIVNKDGQRSLLVVREPEGPPPGLAGAAPSSPAQGKVVENLGKPAGTNLLQVETEGAYTHLRTQFIPDYTVVFAEELRKTLEARPKFATDFPDGVKAGIGDSITFGQDIGYSGDTCGVGQGRGYWPPATFCATANITDIYLPNKPEPASDVCYTSLGQVGIFLNGVILFNWSDAQSYQNKNVWHNIAFTFEQYDFDICNGHAAAGVYHHHGYNGCLAKVIKDDGSGHSPVWGFAADGYPIHGPWQAKDVRARSCWVKRDYAATSATGCGVDGKRSCQLVDNHDIGKGSVDVTAAPDVGAAQESLFSKNPITVDSGSYFEDYYYDPACTAGDPQALDEHNGHDHDDLGYHFHLTVDENLQPKFPYSFGPIYKGRLFDNAMTRCGTKPFVAGPPPPDDKAAIDRNTRWTQIDANTVGKRF